MHVPVKCPFVKETLLILVFLTFKKIKKTSEKEMRTNIQSSHAQIDQKMAPFYARNLYNNWSFLKVLAQIHLFYSIIEWFE